MGARKSLEVLILLSIFFIVKGKKFANFIKNSNEHETTHLIIDGEYIIA